jgi:hypothetical protein
MEAKQMNIFFTRCLVNDKVCELFIDRKYWINMASTSMVEKWRLPILEHPDPYILYSLEDPEFKDMADVLVTKQVRVSFKIGEYEDEVLCDVVPSKTRDLLLGLPWQQQRRAKHDQHTNTYTFSFKNCQIIIAHDKVGHDQILKRRVRKEESALRIERGIAAIFKTFEEELLQIQNDYKKRERDVEKIEDLIVKESHEKDFKKEKEEKKVSEKVNEEENVRKFWPTITLVPSSKLVCVVKCWDSSNILHSPNLSSLTHEGNQANEEVFSQQVENSHVLWKNDYVPKSQGEKFLHSSLQFYAGLDLRSNPLKEGKNDEIKSSLSMWKETYKKIHEKMNKNWPKNTKYGYFVCLIHFKASKALNGVFCVFISCKGVLKTKEKQSIKSI